ncbi:hypothetical protein SODALDRAFT_187384 [Sodiomyces alkalinus F11]|uniref:Uncharacterized protein n=1 Tax=Sodiomyces alkalinus (strain CBS 110278 / VKM F-3762 / F11) TaxID=1314773 RepID=A0A3N2PRC0_SODAK|nr:hypothetical protein SODALDRAFT_187384 [Sodiomyces alkalinus F11]ROT37061.1 hypothetical protein SODALDRAFT_187384 [Sodiomyces alkalinus F11]
MLEEISKIQDWITVNKIKIHDIDSTTVDVSQRLTTVTTTLTKHDERLGILDVHRQTQQGLRGTMGNYGRQLQELNDRLGVLDEISKSRDARQGLCSRDLEAAIKELNTRAAQRATLQCAVTDHDQRLKGFDERLESLDRDVRRPDKDAWHGKVTELDRLQKELGDRLKTFVERLDSLEAHRQRQESWPDKATDHDRRLKALEERSSSNDDALRVSKEETDARDNRLAALEERSRTYDTFGDTFDDHQQRLAKLESLSRDMETFGEGVFELFSRVDSLERNPPVPATTAAPCAGTENNDDPGRRITEYEKVVNEQNTRLQEQESAIREMRAQLAQLAAKQDRADAAQDQQSTSLTKVEKDLGFVKLAVASQSANRGLEGQLVKCLEMAQMFHRRENFPTREHMEASAQLIACLEAAKSSLAVCRNA